MAVCVERSAETLVALWGVLEAGGAWLPLGPERLGELTAFAPAGAPPPLLLTHGPLAASTSLEPSRMLELETLERTATDAPREDPDPRWDELACVLPASEGLPDWRLTHRGLHRLFAAMDSRLRPEEGQTWLAAGEPSSGRPELELAWALSRGLGLVLPEARRGPREKRTAGRGSRPRPLALSLSFFANDEEQPGPRYQLLLEAARFADENGFHAVSTRSRRWWGPPSPPSPGG